MNVSWKVDDGYVNNGPHDFEMDDEEVKSCETVDDALKLIEDYTQTEFENKVRWHFESYDSMKEEVEKLVNEGKQEREKEEA